MESLSVTNDAAATFSAKLCVAQPVERSAPMPAAWRNVSPQEIMARAGKTFHFAGRFFPRAVRDDVAQLYAFCRIADDLADADDVPVDDRRRALDGLERFLLRAYEKGDGGPAGVALLFRQKQVPVALAHELLLGVRSDLERHTIGDFSELRTYCYRVASTVGLMLCHIWGVRDEVALQKAESLGVAMQLTNIARDVGEDLQRNRVYLPHEWLDAFELRETDFTPERLRPVLEKTMHTADMHYAEGLSGLPYLPRFARYPVAVAAHAYRGIHQAIRNNEFDVLHKRASTGAMRKIWIATRVAVGMPPRLPAAAA